MQDLNCEGAGASDVYFSTTAKCLQYRFLIPQSAAAAIISRKGETIKRLRDQYACGIHVSQSNVPERLLVIEAGIDKLCAILAEVFDLVKDCMHSKVNDPKDISSGILPDNVISDEIDLRFLVSENVCGAIIGKGGEVIRRLTDTYRVSVMKVYQQMCPASTDRVIRLVGLPDDLLSCFRGIHDVIKVLKDNKSAREYDTDDYNELHAVNYGGWVTMDARRNMSRLGGPPPATKGPTPSGRTQDQYGGYGDVMPIPVMEGLTLGQMAERLRSHNIMADVGQDAPRVSRAGAVPLMGVPMSHGPNEISHVSLPNKFIGEIMAKSRLRMNDFRACGGTRLDLEKIPKEERLTLGQMSEHLRSENIIKDLIQYSEGVSGTSAAPWIRVVSMSYGANEIANVALSNKLIGAIMGKGGSRINEIRDESGARIDVEKTPIEANSEERVITIQGTNDQIQNAQFLLQQCVRKHGGRQW